MLVGAVLAGLSLYFYAGARSIAIVLFFYLAYWYWRERDRFDDRSAAHLVIFAWLALLVALPLLKFMLTHYQDMMAPWTRMALFGDPGRGRTHMELEMQRTGKTELGVMVDQVLKSFLAFNYYHDPTFHYRPEMPLLQFLPSIFFVFGIVYVFQNWRRREHFLLLVWFSLVLIFGGVLLENPPSSHRLILAAPPVAIFVALGVKALSSYVGVVARQSRTVAVAFSLVLVLIFGYQSVSFYFGKYSPERMFTNTNDEVANDLGKYLNFLGQGYQCYLFAAPRIYSGHPPIPFFSRGVVVTDIFEPIQPRADGQIPVPINREKDAVFVFLPERRNELDVVRLYYPEGLIREFRDFKGRLLFVSYEVLI